jgi:hypothetical protein
MTGWRVERTARTAHRPSPVPPAGVSALMPPHSQGAERRVERRASRWGLRALVIGGLAGAAWLLTGAAAHAADRDPTAQGSSLIGSVVHGDAVQPVVTRLPQAAVQPPESSHHAHDQHKLGSVLRIQDLVEAPTAIAGTLDEATHGKRDAGSALGGADRVLRELTAPIRLTGGPVNDRQFAPVTAPLTKVLRPVTDLLPHTVVSAPVAQHHREAPVAQHHREAPDHREAPEVVGSTATRQPDGAGQAHDDAREGAFTAPGPRNGDRETAGTTGTIGQWRPGTTDRHQAAGTTTAAPQTVREAPDGHAPAPLQVHLGAVSGTPAPGSGAPTDGGSAAFHPVAAGGGAVASHRLPIAADAQVRRHDAEAPTVSPD